MLLPWPSPDVSPAWMRTDSSTDHKKGQIIAGESVDNFEDQSTEVRFKAAVQEVSAVSCFCCGQGTATEGRTS